MAKVTVYNKLVRDKIPQIIAHSGKSCATRILGQDTYVEKLEEKLGEELAEYRQSGELEELADLLEVMEALVAARGFQWKQLTDIQHQKREKRGGFDGRLLLVDVTEE